MHTKFSLEMLPYIIRVNAAIVIMLSTYTIESSIQTEGLATPPKSVRDFEILRFHTGFQDFRQDFKISRRISRFQWRFPDFIEDFGISTKISGFQ